MDTDTALFNAAVGRLREGFPERVAIAPSSYTSLSTGATAWWNIVDASGTGVAVACMRFVQADSRHPRYAEYMAEVEARAERLAAIINRGLEAPE